MEIINQSQSNWYTTEYISKNFKCTPDAISMCKSRHKNELIEGVHWRKAAVTSVTGAKYHDIWSKDGNVHKKHKIFYLRSDSRKNLKREW